MYVGEKTLNITPEVVKYLFNKAERQFFAITTNTATKMTKHDKV